jgi:hypothetical protein
MTTVLTITPEKIPVRHSTKWILKDSKGKVVMRGVCKEVVIAVDDWWSKHHHPTFS